MKHIMKCICGQYTMKETCPACGKKTTMPKPPKFSPEDKFGKYRREVRKKELQTKGLI